MIGSVVRSLCCLAAALSSFWPVAAAAQDYIWCVGARDRDPWLECGAFEPCSNVTDFATVAEALAAAAAVGGGAQASHRLCVGGPPTEPYSQRVVFDFTESPVEGDVTVQFVTENRDVNLCPDPVSAPDEAMIEVVGEGGGARAFVDLQGISTRADRCVGSVRRLLRARDASVSLSGRASGVGSPAIELLVSAEQQSIQIHNTRIDGLLGPAVVGGPGSLLLNSSEISDAASVGAPLVDWSGELVVRSSAFVGNVTTSAPLVRHRGSLDLHSSTIASNVAIGAPLLELDAFALRPAFHGIRSSTIARNVVLSEGAATPRAAEPRPFVPFDESEYCLPSGSDAERFYPREQPAWTGSPGGGLVALAPIAPNAAFHVVKTYIVDNTLGGAGEGRLFLASGVDSLRLTLFHNLVNGQAALFQAGSEPRHTLVSSRNLFLDAQPLVGGTLAFVEATGDFASGGAYAAMDAEQGIVGPALAAPPFAARPGPEVLAMTSCGQIELHCPDLLGDCTRRLNETAVCALDAAIAYVPTDAWLAAAALPFPWSGEFFADFDGGSGAVPGPAGWTCDDEAALPLDRDEREGLPRGDADGYTNITDCDNEDVAVVPRLPDGVALTSDPCGDDEGVCYRCPDAPPDPPPDPPAARGPLVGCGPRGCGTPIVPALLVPTLFIVRGRRRGTAPTD